MLALAMTLLAAVIVATAGLLVLRDVLLRVDARERERQARAAEAAAVEDERAVRALASRVAELDTQVRELAAASALGRGRR